MHSLLTTKNTKSHQHHLQYNEPLFLALLTYQQRQIYPTHQIKIATHKTHTYCFLSRYFLSDVWRSEEGGTWIPILQSGAFGGEGQTLDTLI